MKWHQAVRDSLQETNETILTAQKWAPWMARGWPSSYSPLSRANQPKALVANEDYRVIISTSIHVNRMSRRQGENIGAYEEEETISAR
jgi:hypothetical protein